VGALPRIRVFMRWDNYVKPYRIEKGTKNLSHAEMARNLHGLDPERAAEAVSGTGILERGEPVCAREETLASRVCHPLKKDA